MNGSKSGVALLNMGSPASPADTRRFLYQLFCDPAIFRFPGGDLLRPAFAAMISSLRARRVRRRYEAMDGGSPLLEITRRQAGGLEKALASRGIEAPVEVAMRYSPPRADAALRRLMERGAGSVLGLPLYPQYSGTTTGSSLTDLREAARRVVPGLPLREVAGWHGQPAYQSALARRVLACRSRLGDVGGVGVLFVAHSIPVRFVREGDPYIAQVEETVAGVRKRVREMGGEDLPFFLGYQGQVGPVEWVGPPVLDVVGRMVAGGQRQAVVIPVSFVSDHLETLYEIDIQLRAEALERGMERFERVASLNDGPDFLEALADVVTGALEDARG